VRLFFDEDMGKGIPEALRAVGLGNEPNSVEWVRRVLHGPTPDERWIPWAAERGYLAFSCNTGILESQAQRELVIASGLGIVFLTTGQERSVEVLKLILRKWRWRETIEQQQPRPFAYLLPRNGQPRLDARVR